jgi:hypothetical protein
VCEFGFLEFNVLHMVIANVCECFKRMMKKVKEEIWPTQAKPFELVTSDMIGHLPATPLTN